MLNFDCSMNNVLEPFQEFFGADTSTTVDRELQLTNLLIDFLHEVNHKIDQLVLIHLFGMEVGDKE